MESKSALLVSVLVTVRVLELLLRTENTPQRTGNYFYNFFMRNNSSSAVGSSSGSQGGGEEDDKNKIIPPVPVQLKVGRYSKTRIRYWMHTDYFFSSCRVDTCCSVEAPHSLCLP